MSVETKSTRNLKEIQERLKVHNLTALSEKVGLSRMTLIWIRDGNTENITLKTYEKLTTYFGLE